MVGCGESCDSHCSNSGRQQTVQFEMYKIGADVQLSLFGPLLN